MRSLRDTTEAQPADSILKYPLPKPSFHQKERRRFIKLKSETFHCWSLGWLVGYAFTKIYRDPSTEEEIEDLDRNDIIPFNRSAIDHYSGQNIEMHYFMDQCLKHRSITG
jgi:hypothetical protein